MTSRRKGRNLVMMLKNDDFFFFFLICIILFIPITLFAHTQ